MAPLWQWSALVVTFSFLVGISTGSSMVMAGEDEASIQIVYMAKSKNSVTSHIQTLALVLGISEMEAKKAMIYDYTRTINGFAAKLTDAQIIALQQEPAVLKILPGGFQNVAADHDDEEEISSTTSSSSSSVP